MTNRLKNLVIATSPALVVGGAWLGNMARAEIVAGSQPATAPATKPATAPASQPASQPAIIMPIEGRRG